jgi:flagellar export protein FliJ
VLKVRTLREEQARLALAQAQAQLGRSRQALTETEAKFQESLNRLKETTFQDWRAPEYQLLYSYLEHLKLARDGWRERVAQEESVVAEKMLALEKCHQERRLLENLRGKKFLEYRREMTKFLENQSEAIVLSRWSPP